MTRLYNETMDCPYCGKRTTKETAFGRWFRNNDLLDSKFGHVMYDCDFILHRYKFGHSREVQCLMFIEIKTFGALPRPEQKDTLNLVSQFLNNTKKTKHKSRLLQEEDRATVFSTITGKKVIVRAFGYHLLQFEKTNPKDGWIKWDHKLISEDQLIGLVKFELHPQTLQPMDLRSHHYKQPMLFHETISRSFAL